MTLKKLYELQLTRAEHDKIKKKFEKSSYISELKAQKAKIKKIEEEKKALEEEVKELEKKAKKYYLKEMELEEKERKLKESLYGGKVSNPKELASMQEKLTAVREEKEKAEEIYLELTIKVEEIQDQLEKLKSDIDTKKQDYNEKLKGFEAFRSECQQKLNELAEKYKKLKGEIDEKLLKSYEKLYSHFGNTAVVKLNGERCGGCHVELPLSLLQKVGRSDTLVKCESCGRILYDGERCRRNQ